jgi:hypothetical protein
MQRIQQLWIVDSYHQEHIEIDMLLLSGILRFCVPFHA